MYQILVGSMLGHSVSYCTGIELAHCRIMQTMLLKDTWQQEDVVCHHSGYTMASFDLAGLAAVLNRSKNDAFDRLATAVD